MGRQTVGCPFAQKKNPEIVFLGETKYLSRAEAFEVALASEGPSPTRNSGWVQNYEKRSELVPESTVWIENWTTASGRLKGAYLTPEGCPRPKRVKEYPRAASGLM